MKRRKQYFPALILATATLSLLSTAGRAAVADASALEPYLHAAYYEVEFFVFERPSVMEFTSDEILTLNRYRALPRTFRLQRSADGDSGPEFIDPMTRACLTYPTLTYELMPAALEIPPDGALPVSDAASDMEDVDAASPDMTLDAQLLPIPEIQPTLEPDPEIDFLAAMAEYERTLEDGSERWLPAEALQLKREAARIERRGLGRILFHGRWLQAVPPREDPLPVLVVGGETLNLNVNSPTPELVGTVGVTLGRYLHFNADLYFHAPGLGLTPVSAALDPNGTPVVQATAPIENGYMRLSQSRRMRSTELHYLDHPKLGLVVRIDPVGFPEELLQQFERLKALEEDGE